MYDCVSEGTALVGESYDGAVVVGDVDREWVDLCVKTRLPSGVEVKFVEEDK